MLSPLYNVDGVAATFLTLRTDAVQYLYQSGSK